MTRESLTGLGEACFCFPLVVVACLPATARLGIFEAIGNATRGLRPRRIQPSAWDRVDLTAELPERAILDFFSTFPRNTSNLEQGFQIFGVMRCFFLTMFLGEGSYTEKQGLKAIAF